MSNDVESARVTLSRYQNLVGELLNSFTKQRGGGERSSVDIMKDIVSCDAELISTLRNLRAVEEKQRRAALVEEEILRKTRALQDIAGKLKGAEMALIEAITRAKRTIASFEKAQASPLSVDDVVSYAHKICTTSAAPAGWKMGEPLVMHHPPMPTQEEIQQGLHYTKEAMAVGGPFVPSTHASPMLAGGTPLMAHPSPMLAAGSPQLNPYNPSPIMAAGSPIMAAGTYFSVMPYVL